MARNRLKVKRHAVTQDFDVQLKAAFRAGYKKGRESSGDEYEQKLTDMRQHVEKSNERNKESLRRVKDNQKVYREVSASLRDTITSRENELIEIQKHADLLRDHLRRLIYAPICLAQEIEARKAMRPAQAEVDMEVRSARLKGMGIWGSLAPGNPEYRPTFDWRGIRLQGEEPIFMGVDMAETEERVVIQQSLGGHHGQEAESINSAIQNTARRVREQMYRGLLEQNLFSERSNFHGTETGRTSCRATNVSEQERRGNVQIGSRVQEVPRTGRVLPGGRTIGYVYEHPNIQSFPTSSETPEGPRQRIVHARLPDPWPYSEGARWSGADALHVRQNGRWIVHHTYPTWAAGRPQRPGHRYYPTEGHETFYYEWRSVRRQDQDPRQEDIYAWVVVPVET